MDEEDETAVERVLTQGCLDVNRQLDGSAIDNYVSGSTMVSVLIAGDDVWCANVGDSRAVLGCVRSIDDGRSNGHCNGNGDRTSDGKRCDNYEADASGPYRVIELSDDHKPDRPDEQARILGMGGKIYLISLAACLKSHRDLITFEQGGFSSGESLVCGSQMSTCLAWRWAVASATAQLNR